MRWKDILAGAAVSLAVTVLGGVAVYYYTTVPDYKRTESLLYSILETASFKGGQQELTFSSVRVANEGGIAAKRVSILVSVNTAEVRDLSLDVSAGSREISREVKPKSVHITYETLLPEESVTLNLLLSSSEKPAVAVRSDATLGVERPLEIASSLKRTPSRINEFFKLLVPLTGFGLPILFSIVFLLLRRRGYIEPSSSNNAGFLLLHQGLVDDATAILTAAVRSGAYDPFTLSNLAVCTALAGDHGRAARLMRAASFRDWSGHAKAVLLLNQALISLASGHKDDAIATLRQAIARSRRKIRGYCQHSVHLDAVRNEPAFYELMKDA